MNLQVPCSPVLLLEQINFEVHPLNAIALAQNLNGAKLLFEMLNERGARRKFCELMHESTCDWTACRITHVSKN